MIPVLGIPILNRFDCLERLLRSISPASLGTLWIVDNRPAMDCRPLESLVPELRHFTPGLRIIRPQHNLGVAGSWNLILMATPGAPYWVLANDDIEFLPDGLRLLEAAVDLHVNSKVAIFAHGFSCVAITGYGVMKVGLFDENFWPAYYEDCDWHVRSQLLNLQFELATGVVASHGDQQRPSSTLHSSLDIKMALGYCMASSLEYYIRKWGGEPGAEIYPSPFNTEGCPLSAWQPEFHNLALRRGIFDSASLRYFHDLDD